MKAFNKLNSANKTFFVVFGIMGIFMSYQVLLHI